MFKSILPTIGAASVGAIVLGVAPALADPPPLPVTELPPVFCFRFTNIKAVADDPGQDKFQLEFEVLNWSDTPAGGVRIALNTGTPSQDMPPRFMGADVDFNGRPLGSTATPLPGNQLFTNTGAVTASSPTAIQWTASQLPFATTTSTPIPNRDLLGVDRRTACSLVPGCAIVGNIPQVADWETVDNGNNVLDGFVITVDDLDAGEWLSFNWNLLDENGNPIGMPGVGNEYGFGTVNIARRPIDDPTESEFKIFPGNTGVDDSSRIFAEEAHRVTEFINLTTPPTSPLVSSLAETPETDHLIALFAAEFGAGITAPFLNPEDNIFNSAINTQPIDNGGGDNGGGDNGGGDNGGGDNGGGDNSGGDNSGGGTTTVPEPSTLLGLTVLGLLFAKSRSGAKAE